MKLSATQLDLLKVVGVLVAMCIIAVAAAWVAAPSHAACIPDLVINTPTPTIKGDSAMQNVALIRVYGQLEGSMTWDWTYDIPYNYYDPDYVPAFPVITQDWPIQRLIPSVYQLVNVRVMVKGVNADNVESAPSEILTICMPQLCDLAAHTPCN